MDTIWNIFKIRLPEDSEAIGEEILGNCLAMWDHEGYYEADLSGREWHVYFHPDSSPLKIGEELPKMAAELGMPGVQVFGPFEAPRENWHDAWRQYFRPVEITERTVIVPSWEEHLAEAYESAGKIVLRIEPGMAFGTGTHATTQLCLKMAEGLITPGCRVLDAGTGSAILAIHAAKLGAGHTLGFDLDPDVEDNVADNLRLNKITPEQVEVKILPLDELPIEDWDVIYCNMLSHEFIPLLPGLSQRLKKDSGRIILSGMLNEEGPEVSEIIKKQDINFEIVQQASQGEWLMFICKKS